MYFEETHRDPPASRAPDLCDILLLLLFGNRVGDEIQILMWCERMPCQVFNHSAACAPPVVRGVLQPMAAVPSEINALPLIRRCLCWLSGRKLNEKT
jgi:hypothetical protein